jgi:hypothetical protein
VDRAVKFADLATQPPDIGAGERVERVKGPRRHVVGGFGNGRAGVGEERAELGIEACADDCLQPRGEPLLDRVVRLAIVRALIATSSQGIAAP